MILLTRRANKVTVLVHSCNCQTRGTNNNFFYAYIRSKNQCVLLKWKSHGPDQGQWNLKKHIKVYLGGHISHDGFVCYYIN